MYKFEKLLAWQESVNLIKICYSVIDQLPSRERGCLVDQLRRAVTSISLNIAEGSGAGSDRDFKSFLRIAIKSQHEVVAILMIAKELYPSISIEETLSQCETVGKLVNGLIKKLSANK